MGDKPAKKFRLGFVTATVWKNGEHFNTTLTRAYKNGDDEWVEGDQLNTGDLMNGAKLLSRCEDWIALQQ